MGKGERWRKRERDNPDMYIFDKGTRPETFTTVRKVSDPV